MTNSYNPYRELRNKIRFLNDQKIISAFSNVDYTQVHRDLIYIADIYIYNKTLGLHQWFICTYMAMCSVVVSISNERGFFDALSLLIAYGRAM